MKFNSTILSILSLMFSIALVAYIVLNKAENEPNNSQKYIATLKDETIKLQQQVATLTEKYTGLETQLNNVVKHKKVKTTKMDAAKSTSPATTTTTQVVTVQDTADDSDSDVDLQIKKLSSDINKMKAVINKLNRRINKFDDSSDGSCPFRISDRNTGRLSCVQ